MTRTPKSIVDCEKNGIPYEVFSMECDRSTKRKRRWIGCISKELVSVEESLFQSFRSEGWEGTFTEGNLVLQLLDACSHERYPVVFRNSTTSVISYMGHSFDEWNFDRSCLCENILSSDLDRVINNWKIMSNPDPLVVRDRDGWEIQIDTNMMMDDPSLTLENFVGLYQSLGKDLLFDIATIFSSDPYRFRSGWSDLTLWRDGKVRFVEVKGPGDTLHESQFSHIDHFVRRLNLDYSVAVVLPS